MNRWLYRAAGTVGIAGGFLLLGAGSAQADETENGDALLGDVFSPTSGLPPLDLPVGNPGTPDASTLNLDPHDGRLGEPELLPGLPALPIGGLDSLLNTLPLNTLPLDSVPLDAAGLPGGVIGTGGPLADGGQLPDDLLRIDGDPIGLPTRLVDSDAPRRSHPPTGFRTLPAPAPVGPAAASTTAGGRAAPAAGAEQAEIIGSMPFLTGPINDTLLPGQSLSGLAGVGALVGQVPVAGPTVDSNLRGLPLVNEIVPSPLQQSTQLTGDPLTGPVTADQLPPVIANELAAERGHSPELIGNGLPLIGDGLAPLGQMVGVGNLPQQLPLVGPLAGPLLGGLPVVGDSDPAASGVPGVPAAPGTPALPNPLQDPAAAAGERPIAGEDPEYAESAYTGSPEVLPGLPALPVDPLAVLQSLPLVGPLTGSLPL